MSVPSANGRRSLDPSPRRLSLRDLVSLGAGLKRWLFLGSMGAVFIALSAGYAMSRLINGTPSWIPFSPLALASVVAGIGILLALAGWWGVTRATAQVMSRRGSATLPYHQLRALERGPRIVAIGGGTGLSTLLRGLKHHSNNISAVVTVTDDGGSSGVLRREMGVLPPGDIRNCLVALSDAEPLLTRLFQHRFAQGAGLEGHSFGNLFLVAMTEVCGDFDTAIYHASQVLAVRGQILPSTLENVNLVARMEDGAVVEGESAIPDRQGRIAALSLNPEAPLAYAEAVKAILEAQLIVIGPGSLYTSVIPNLMVRGIRQAIEASPALSVYVCNVATQPGETTGYSVEQHVHALTEHVGPGIVDWVLADSGEVSSSEEHRIPPPLADDAVAGIPLYTASVINPAFPHHHDPALLADALMRLHHRPRPRIAATSLDTAR